jgi:hypothetical protein
MHKSIVAWQEHSNFVLPTSFGSPRIKSYLQYIQLHLHIMFTYMIWPLHILWKGNVLRPRIYHDSPH